MTWIGLPRYLENAGLKVLHPVEIKRVAKKWIYRRTNDCSDELGVEEWHLELDASQVQVLEVVEHVAPLIVQHQEQIELSTEIGRMHGFELILYSSP